MTLSMIFPQLFAFGAGFLGCPWCIFLPLLLMLGAWLLGWLGAWNWMKSKFFGINQELEGTKSKYSALRSEYDGYSSKYNSLHSKYETDKKNWNSKFTAWETEKKSYTSQLSSKPKEVFKEIEVIKDCLLYTSPSPRDATLSRMPSSA